MEQMTELPFIVLFSDDETSFDEDFGSGNKIDKHPRQKRFVEITADVGKHKNEVYNYYDHDEFNEIDNRVLPVEIKKIKNDRYDMIESNYEYNEEDDDELFLDYERDDMSEHEASNHRFSVAKVAKQDVLPYPKWWDKKKGKKQPRKKKQKKKFKKKNRENETFQNSKVDKWNTLPKIWKSFGREVSKYLILLFI